jgi:hypothetical protein
LSSMECDSIDIQAVGVVLTYSCRGVPNAGKAFIADEFDLPGRRSDTTIT